MREQRSSNGRRSKQVANEIRDEIVNIVRHELNDHRLDRIGAGMVTISGLDMSEDRRNATVWASFMGRDKDSKEVKDALDALNSSAAFIHRLLIKRLHMKVHPHLAFKYDPSFDRAASIQPAFAEAAEIEKETARVRKESDESGSNES